jgi:divalent metal cation (Fe/Co/Zn/Cd) transporter
MTKHRSLIVPAVIVGIVLLVVAAIYVAEPAKSLPSFFPGHEAGSTHHHVKHGLAALIVALGAFVLAWFQTGPARPSAT